MRNAFNLASRQAMLSECKMHFPELLSWVSWCYGEHPLLWHFMGSLTLESGVQQGDPLVPLLFSPLVLNILVTTIAIDNDCSSLQLQAWYLDNGIIAGPRSALLRVLSLIQQEGPSLGFFINLRKCEIFSHCNLEGYPEQLIKSNNPCLEVLGISIGDKEFCTTFISTKCAESRILLVKLEEVGAIDPHVALILIRLCGGFCCLNHLARATPPSLSAKALEMFDEDVWQCFSASTGIDTSDGAWQQAQLSLSRGGLGLRSLSRHASAAFIASLSSSGSASDSIQHLSDAVVMFNDLVLCSPRQWHKLQTNLLKIETPHWEKKKESVLIQTITMALSTWSFIRALRGNTTIAKLPSRP